jgi:hypothetical protein
LRRKIAPSADHGWGGYGISGRPMPMSRLRRRSCAAHRPARRWVGTCPVQARGAHSPDGREAQSGSTIVVLAARSWDFLSLPNCAPEVFVHARRHVFVVRIRDVFAYGLRVQEAVTANAAMPLLAGEDVWTPLGVFRIVFGMGHFKSCKRP